MMNTTLFGWYLLSSQVSQTDLFTTYRGNDQRTGNAVIATVVNPENVSAGEFLARFEPLAKTIALIESPHVIKALEFGETDGRVVIVWEGIDGRTLPSLTGEGNESPLDFSLDIARQLGKYLESIHNRHAMQGVFIPNDIFITEENAVKVIHSGFWQAINIEGLLSEGKVKAAPYFAPELMLGKEADVRTDFYSLGAVLFQLLTGKEPETRTVALGQDSNVGLMPGQLRAGIPDELNELVAKCLQPDPAKRIQSAAEFISRIEDIQRGSKKVSLMGMEDSLVGHTLGAYRLVERLGQGGMATVYKAYEAALDRYVAVKVLPQFFATDPTFIQRFRREAKAVAQLNHPNIVPIYSYGEENGITYIAMQFIEGGTLKHEEGLDFNFEAILRFLLPITRALGYAHKRGIVHRDIKPSNVLVSEGNWPLLTDFGLAQMAGASIHLTESGVGLGTPAYMSPEQGQGDKVDQRTDIYSLGIMLYELTTGDTPFHADTPLAIVIKHLSAPMPIPRHVNPEIPEEVETIILKATAKKPDDRYQSADEMADAMEKALSRITTSKEAGVGREESRERVASAAPSPQVPSVPVAAAKPKQQKPRAKMKFTTPVIVLMSVLGLSLLGIFLMATFDLCPPDGSSLKLPWCAGYSNAMPVISTPVITEGKLGAILFQDDFDESISSRWQFTASPYLVSWVAEEFEGRTVFHSLPPNPPGDTSDAEIRDTQWKNYSIQFDFRFLKPDQFGYHYFYLRGRITGCPPTIRSVQTYEFIISPDQKLLKKSFCREGSQVEIAASDKDFVMEGWHTLQSTYTGNRVQLFIDGEQIIDYTDPENWLEGGDLWIETPAPSEMLFDNLKVYEIVP